MRFFNKIFGNRKPKSGLQALKFMNGYTPVFTDSNGALYENFLIRSSIHCIASNVAKANIRHIRKMNNKVQQGDVKLERKLRLKPNPIMSGFDFVYRVVSQYEENNNALIYITQNDKKEYDFYPLNFATVEFLENDSGDIFIRNHFKSGSTVDIPYENIIHLRKHFNKHDLFGESNQTILYPTIKLLDTVNDGIINAVKSSAYLRGILKYTGILKKEDIKADRDRFVEEYLSTENNGGIGALDSKADFIKTELKPHIVDADQMKLIKENVFDFFNINESILTSDFTETQWDAFYENVLEPILIQLSQGFTGKFFTDKELGFGNEIIFEANRLQYVSLKTKVLLIEKTAPYGILKVNEARDILNLEPVEDGDVRILAVGGKAEQIGGDEDGSQEGNEDNGSSGNTGQPE